MLMAVDVTRWDLHNEKPLGTVKVRERSMCNPPIGWRLCEQVSGKTVFAQPPTDGQGGFCDG